jgi:signal transduction histidine kinase
MTSSEVDPDRVVGEDPKAFEEALHGVHVEEGGTRVWLPLETAQGARYAARIDLRGPAAPAEQVAGAVRGIATVMALGTALLLLNVVIVTSRLVLRPLERLADASARVARGDYSQKVPEEGAYDEMGGLIRAFNGMQEQIAHHRRSLEGEVARARGKVTETQRALFAAQRLTTAGTLAAGVAHEINNPLGGMLNAVKSLREGSLDDAKRAEYLGLVADGLERIRAIVQRMLQFGPRSIDPRPVNLRDAVDAAAAFLGHRLRAKEVEIRNELPAGLPQVQGDPLELQQAFLNVLINAVDACAMGEGVVTVYGRADGDRVAVRVADNGCGMDDDERARCLDPFFTTKDPGEGTGLGLAVAHNIATAHGGSLAIDSERGKGTTVTFTFPAARSGVATAGGPG